MSELRVQEIHNPTVQTGGIEIDNNDVVSINGQALPTAGAFGNRNLIINGNMLIDQRNSGSSTTPSGDQTYVFDRWKVRNSNATGRFSVEQSGTSPNDIDPSMLLTVTTTDTPSGVEFYAIEQPIEGHNFARAAAGSANSEILTLTFFVRSSLTGTYCVSLRNSDASRSFVAEYTIDRVDTWEPQTIEVPAITTGTWNTTTGTGASVAFCLGSGPDREGSTGWQSANAVATSNQVDWINSNGATFFISGVQLEVGSVATPFERLSYSTQLALCQRYYLSIVAVEANSRIAIAGNGSINQCFPTFFAPTTMRAAPAIDFSAANDFQVEGIAGGGKATATSITINRATTESITVQVDTAGGTGASGGNLLSENNNVWFAFNAEL